MKVSRGERHGDDVGAQSTSLPVLSSDTAVVAQDFNALYDRYFHEVVRWCRSMGVPASELEDLAQEVFVVAARKLDGFDWQNPAGWLYRITSLIVRRSRRRPWFKYLFARRQEVETDSFEWMGGGPFESYERKQAQALLQKILLQMSEKRRVAFVLFEVEGYSGEEMAQLLDIPLATVWTRLYHARQEFLTMAKALGEEVK